MEQLWNSVAVVKAWSNQKENAMLKIVYKKQICFEYALQKA